MIKNIANQNPSDFKVVQAVVDDITTVCAYNKQNANTFIIIVIILGVPLESKSVLFFLAL